MLGTEWLGGHRDFMVLDMSLHFKLHFVVTAVEPPPGWGVELGLQWSWCAVTAVRPPPRMTSWTWPTVKLICSDCSWTPPRMTSWTWPAVKLICSDYSWSPPGWGVELGLQWSWSAVTTVESPPGWEVELGLQWSWSAVTAVRPPPPGWGVELGPQ